MKIITFTSKKVAQLLANFFFFIVFVVSPPSMTMADVPGRYGANNCPIERFSGSPGSPGCALLGNALRIATAHSGSFAWSSKLPANLVYFFHRQLTKEYTSRRTISKLIYCFKQNQATASSRSPSGGYPAC